MRKINEEAKKSLETCQGIYEETIKGSTNYKYKAKLMQDDTKKLNEDEKGLHMSVSFQKAPKIVKMMEERARLREEKRLLIKERKR